MVMAYMASTPMAVETVESPPSARRALIIEKTKLHILFIEPLAAHLLVRGWDVSVVAPPEAWHRLAPWADRFPGKLIFLEHGGMSLRQVLLNESFDYIFLSPLDFWNKVKRRKLLDLINVLQRQLTLFVGFLLRNRSTRIVPGIHETQHFERMESKSVWPLSKAIDAHLWRRMIRRADAFTVVSRKMRDKCIASRMTTKPVLVPPVALFAEDKALPAKASDRPLRIVLPGRIDPRLRNYDWIERVPTHWIGKVSIRFVGKPMGDAGRHTIDRLRQRGFTQPEELGMDFIPEPVFDQLVGGAHFLFAPIPRTTSLAGRLGEDRMFGVGFSTIRYGKPMLLPTWTPVDEEFEGNVVRYAGTEELIAQIDAFLENPDLVDVVSQKALANARKFMPERFDFGDELLALE